MTSLNKQLVMHGFPLPVELIRIIKDFTFMDTIMSQSKKKKNIITKMIFNTIWCGRARPQDEEDGLTLFWIEEDSQSRQFQPSFCKTCGDFHGDETNYPNEGRVDRVVCHCFQNL
jgi:hypothetical protein